MNKISCSVLRDLLPNYIDNLTEEETNIIIEEHLTECDECKAIYEEMKCNIKFSTIKAEARKENQVRDLFNQAKLGYMVKTIFNILRLLSIIIYVGMNIILLFIINSKVKYLSFFERNTVLNILLMSSITLIIPGILILVLYIKKDYMILKIVKGILQFLLFALMPYIFIIGLIIGLRTPSYTTNYENYKQWDLNVEKLLDRKEFSILPNELPENISDINYLYKYEVIFDDQYLTLNVSWTYNDKVDYERVKSDMISYTSVSKEKSENEYQLFYAIDSGTDNKNQFRFGYDDTTKRVTYQIDYEWVN